MDNGAPTATAAGREPLIGLAPLVRLAFSGGDLAPLREGLRARLESDPLDANAWMDMSTLLLLNFERDMGLMMQAEALRLQRLYHLPADGRPALRLLVLKAAGELMDNTPVEFLLESSDVAIDQLYLPADPDEWPEHDVVFVAIGQSAENDPLLLELQEVLRDWPKPVLNMPARIAATTRDGVHAMLSGTPGLLIPPTACIDRAGLARLGDGTTSPESLLAETAFPLIVRPVGSHAGHGLDRLDAPADIDAYLQAHAQDAFYISGFVDYSGADGLFRKFRVVLIDGEPFPGHMAVSQHWIIHYLNAGMHHSADKRREEARFIEGFQDDFAPRHAEALRAIHQRIGLDYLVIDCAEMQDGRLLVFEVDSGGIVHDMDPEDIFPYKSAYMHKLFDAFSGMLAARAHSKRG